MFVASPPVEKAENGEVLSISVNDRVTFAWSLQDLHSRYEQRLSDAVPEELARLHETIVTISARVAEAWKNVRTKDIHDWQVTVQRTEELSQLLKSYSAAASEFLVEPGVRLDRAILVPPRSRIRVETSDGTAATVYLRGLRARYVQ